MRELARLAARTGRGQTGQRSPTIPECQSECPRTVSPASTARGTTAEMEAATTTMYVALAMGALEVRSDISSYAKTAPVENPYMARGMTVKPPWANIGAATTLLAD